MDNDSCENALGCFSLSFGTSLFAGFIYESKFTNGAMAYNYMFQRNNDAYVIILPIEKLKNSPFFVPDSNIVAQLAGYGETFHARSVKASDREGVFGFKQMGWKSDYLDSPFTQEQINAFFLEYKKNAVILKKGEKN